MYFGVQYPLCHEVPLLRGAFQMLNLMKGCAQKQSQAIYTGTHAETFLPTYRALYPCLLSGESLRMGQVLTSGFFGMDICHRQR